MKKRIVFIGISILILVLLIWYSNPFLLAETVAKSNFNYLILAFGVATLAIFVRVLKWNVLLKGVRFGELLPVQMFGITISNFTPGKIAEPIKAFVLKARKGIPVATSLPSVIWERILDVIVLIILSLLVLQIFGFQSKIIVLSAVSIGLFAALLAVLLFMLHNKNFGYRLFKALRRLPLFNRLSEDFMKNFYESSIGRKRLLSCFALTLMAWILDGVVFYLTLTAIGVTINPIILAGIIALSVLIGVASTLPGGLGSTEAVMILLLGILGVQSTTAVAGVMISRFISFWYGTLIGGLSFVYLSKKIDMKKIL